jgi:hypothetical protein
VNDSLIGFCRALRFRTAEDQERVGRRRPEYLDHGLLVEAAFIGYVHEVTYRGAGALDVHQGSATASRQIPDIDRSEIDTEPGQAGRIRNRGMELGARERQDLTRRWQYDQFLIGV